MSIESAKFIVQRGDEQFSCRGDELKDKLEEGDLMIVQHNSDSEASKWEMEAVPPPPWSDRNNGIFHIKNATETVKLSGGSHVAWDVDGTNERPITEIASGEELVFGSPTSTYELFQNNTGTWDFGDFTDTSKVTNMNFMFYGCQQFNGSLGGNWDTSSVTSMNSMFWEAKNFNQDISGWDTSEVTSMITMFQFASFFNQDLSDWCVSKISSLPLGFDSFADAWTKPRPVWGTCPRGEDS